MPEPAPAPNSIKLLDSAIIEQDYSELPGLASIEKDEESEVAATPEAPPEAPAETAAQPSADATPRNEMRHNATDSANLPPVAPAPRQTGLPSCPIPPEILQARAARSKFLDTVDEIRSMEEEFRLEDKMRKSAASEMAEEEADEMPLAG